MPDFKPGDIVIDISCTAPTYGNNGRGLIGVVDYVEPHLHSPDSSIWGSWRYANGWQGGMHSLAYFVRHYTGPDYDEVLADYTKWRLLNG